MKIIPALLFLLFSPAALMAAQTGAPDVSKLREGDLVFIHSTSSQASAIEEATASSWTHVGVLVKFDSNWQVAEAAAAVKYTPLEEFIARSRGGEYEVKRYSAWDTAPDKKGVARLKKWLKKNLGKKYDIYFEWSDETMYCSEYAWKAYHYALGGKSDISVPQKFSEVKLSGPMAQALFSKRYAAAGRKFDPEGLIVTPVALYDSPQLKTVAVR